MPRPHPDWISALPRSRLLAEYSMWSANLIRLADDLERITPHADILHIDVADGHFAPALLFFPDLVAGLRALTAIPIHVHLMVDAAVLLSQIDQFAEAGADLISVHVENANAGDGLQRIAAHGLKAGMVLRVETPVAKAAEWVSRLDMLTLLGTAIGVKGQGLDPTAGARLGEAAALIAGAGRRVILAADGGIRDTTVPLLRGAGAETVVMGSLAFGAPDLAERMLWLHGL
ncbi:ribulose-phosphate 3-epimerase [Cypionkella sp.]|uniref:ribulose-phosphate 3-epimerase n=1 Tax=Cypionkella sp. TaxID=2811411 RepID=UPI00272257CB|nr:ribulose-phosphate 3-epimerase [Cypionkella sp.]MDO8983577.1 ribulose-phosphate 3-epimerase [Cypionkella sp.]MDP1578405.1 ribulose-phosphate 3-epimerase [Cypionkella sp.]MDP2048372.1 ribulose-phosphate 3-epimerase [Cypionkella sp.]